MIVVLFVAFLGTVVGANWAVTEFGIKPIGFGLSAPAGVYFAGLAFTLRDILHERSNRYWVIVAILGGAGLSALLEGGGRIALASGVAFLVSESVDFSIYAPMRRRGWLKAVLASNVAGLCVDSLLFLYIAFSSLQFIEGQIIAKAYMTGIAVVMLYTVRKVRWSSIWAHIKPTG